MWCSGVTIIEKRCPSAEQKLRVITNVVIKARIPRDIPPLATESL
jgi:hypothetical protein